MVAKVLLLNGPNLNLLGTREPEIYGRDTLSDIGTMSKNFGQEVGLDVDFRQSNLEGELVTWIQQAGAFAALIINGGAYTHTSVAILDALKTFRGPIIELHLSNNFRREAFRHMSFISKAATGIVEGFGASGYRIALFAISELLRVPSIGPQH